MFDAGEEVVCIKSGADAPNPWHAANPLTVGRDYTILRVVSCVHASGRRLPDLYAVDASGRLWSADHFARRASYQTAKAIMRRALQNPVKVDAVERMKLWLTSAKK